MLFISSLIDFAIQGNDLWIEMFQVKVFCCSCISREGYYFVDRLANFDLCASSGVIDPTSHFIVYAV